MDQKDKLSIRAWVRGDMSIAGLWSVMRAGVEAKVTKVGEEGGVLSGDSV